MRLDAHTMRATVEQRFSPIGMVADYVAAYQLALSFD
jgi:hypothetical protein